MRFPVKDAMEDLWLSFNPCSKLMATRPEPVVSFLMAPLAANNKPTPKF